MGVSIERVQEWVIETTVGMTGDEADSMICPFAVLLTYDEAMRGAVKDADGDWNRFWNAPDAESMEPGTPTHYVRFLYTSPGYSTDGDEWWVRIEGDEIELLTLPDVPALSSADEEEAIEWCREPLSW